MPYRLANRERGHTIVVNDTVLHIVSLTIGEKEKLLLDIQNVGENTGAFDRLVDILCGVVTKVEGFEKTPKEVFSQLEYIGDLRDTVKAILEYCSLTGDEIKNSPSSLVPHTPVSVGNVEPPVVTVGGPVSTTVKPE